VSQVSDESRRLVSSLYRVPPARRGALLQAVASFRPQKSIESEFLIGNLRAEFADLWETLVGCSIPLRDLREVMEPPVPIGTVLCFCRLNVARTEDDIADALRDVVRHLRLKTTEIREPKQIPLFETCHSSDTGSAVTVSEFAGKSVRRLSELLDSGCRYSTIYADPPWAYSNTSSRAAAENHYPTLSVAEISELPIEQLAAADSHLHLWTTNGFLRESFEVIDAWGFTYKSCLVWVKSEIGMGNYWRVSHEFLMLGVRGQLTFADRTLPSWVQAPRTIHSKKPGVVRSLVEKTSPGPYLELFGREALPDSQWTVFGNQVEQRLF